MRSLADDQNFVIKKADKGSCMVVLDWFDYLMEAEKQLSDKNIYKEVKFNENLIQDLTETSNKIFWSLKNGDFKAAKTLNLMKSWYKTLQKPVTKYLGALRMGIL